MTCPKCGEEAIRREEPRKAPPLKGHAEYIHKERWEGGWHFVDKACWVKES